jgi:nitronate monooxygenase
MEHGVWSAGTVMGLIRDVPTCKELVERIVREAEEMIRGRLAKAIAA